MDWPTLRRLAVKYQLDPRTIRKEEREPNSVKGMAGSRARAAVAEVLFRPANDTEPQHAA